VRARSRSTPVLSLATGDGIWCPTHSEIELNLERERERERENARDRSLVAILQSSRARAPVTTD